MTSTICIATLRFNVIKGVRRCHATIKTAKNHAANQQTLGGHSRFCTLMKTALTTKTQAITTM
ncbi:hypothetical protein [Desulforapulum autotrophicum]|uniref:hypothetical protein n=1 Tax=Desulforapulum autotrophicum TaxID=2296 RepID=UPI001E381CAA|nr:hypothetical protein [Desulforapulum autotrophicum]